MKRILTLLTVTILFLTYALVSQESTGAFLDLKSLKNNEITTDNKSQIVDRAAFKDKEKFHEMMKTALKNIARKLKTPKRNLWQKWTEPPK